MRLIVKVLIPAVLLAVGSLAVSAEDGGLKTTAAEYVTLPREYRLDGVVEAINQTTVSAQTQGQVQEILYDVDDFVEKDAVLIRLQDIEHQARVTRAAADLKEAVARLEQAKDEHGRTQDLYKKKLASESAMDAAEAELKSAQARYEAAGAGLIQAQEQLRYTVVRAPYSGIVTQRFVQIGEMAQPGQPLIRGISLEQLRVLVDVPQSLVPAIRQQEKARVQLPDQTWAEASRITVFPFADYGSNTFKVRLALPGGLEKLFPGMFVKTAFTTGEKSELVVPEEAVVYRSEVTGIYVVDDTGGVHFRQVRIGRPTDDGRLVVLAGVTAGERVALDPIAAGAVLKRQARERTRG